MGYPISSYYNGTQGAAAGGVSIPPFPASPNADMIVYMPDGQRINLSNMANYNIDTANPSNILFTPIGMGAGTPITVTTSSPANAVYLLAQMDSLVGGGTVSLNGSTVQITTLSPSPCNVTTTPLVVNGRGYSGTEPCGFNYAGGTGLATTKLTGSGNNALTVTPVIINGAIASATVVNGGGSYANGDIFLVTDTTGLNGYMKVATSAAGVVATVTAVTNGFLYINSHADGLTKAGFVFTTVNNGDSSMTATKILVGDGTIDAQGNIAYYISADGRVSNVLDFVKISV